MPSLLTFRGRVPRRPYLVLQILSAAFLISGVTFIFMAIDVTEQSGAACYIDEPGITLTGWAVGAAAGTLIASMWIGAAAVTRRARDGALPAVFVGILYILNRLLLPVTIGLFGPTDLREMALLLAYIMFIIQILLVARDTVPLRVRGPSKTVT